LAHTKSLGVFACGVVGLKNGTMMVSSHAKGLLLATALVPFMAQGTTVSATETERL